MNAQQAREQSKKAAEQRTDQSLLKVYKDIETAVKKGEFYCYHYYLMTEHTKETLVKQGYAIERLEDRPGEFTFKIIW